MNCWDGCSCNNKGGEEIIYWYICGNCMVEIIGFICETLEIAFKWDNGKKGMLIIITFILCVFCYC